MNIDFPKLAEALNEAGLMAKSASEMTKEEIEALCKIVHTFSSTEEDDLPF